MQLVAQVELYAGGPGSGCQGPNCGRPGYHGTTEQSAQSILKRGFRPDAYVSLDKEAAIDYALDKMKAREGKTFVVLTVGDTEKAGFKQSENAPMHLHALNKVGSEHVSKAERYRITKIDKAGVPYFEKVEDLK